MKNKIGSCIVAGHICLDIIPDILGQRAFLDAIQPGHLLPIGAPTVATGGSVSNTGLALHKLGINTRLMGKLGNDSFGREVLSRLTAVDKNLANGMRTLADEQTSYTIILSPSDADRVFLHSTGANDTFGPEDIDYAALYEVDPKGKLRELSLTPEVKDALEAISTSCEMSMVSGVYIGGAGGSARAGVTQAPLALTRAVHGKKANLTVGGAPIFLFPGGGINFMVDVEKVKQDFFYWTPTPATICPLEYTMELKEYKKMGGHVEAMKPFKARKPK